MVGVVRNDMESHYGDFASGDVIQSQWGDDVNATLDDTRAKALDPPSRVEIFDDNCDFTVSNATLHNDGTDNQTYVLVSHSGQSTTVYVQQRDKNITPPLDYTKLTVWLLYEVSRTFGTMYLEHQYGLNDAGLTTDNDRITVNSTLSKRWSKIVDQRTFTDTDCLKPAIVVIPSSSISMQTKIYQMIYIWEK